MSASASQANSSVHSSEFFPPLAIKYFFYCILSIVCVAFVLDRWILPELENRGLLACENWRLQDEGLCRHMLARNHGRFEDPLCYTNAIPVSEKCPRGKRILVMGDSYVWGHGVANWNHLWWRQLQNELERRGYDVEVIGAGICGSNTHDELDFAPALMKKYHPDLLIWSYVINDPIELRKDRSALVPMQPVITKTEYTGLAGFLHPYFPNLVYHLVSLRSEVVRKKFSNQSAGYCWDEWELRILQGENFELYKQTIARLSAFIEKSQVPQFVVTMPAPDRERFEARLAPVKKLFKENGIVCLDVLDDMIVWYQKNFPGVKGKPELAVGVCPVDNHPGPAATHFYATETADFLEKNYATALGTKGAFAQKAKLNINDWLPISLQTQQIASDSFRIIYPETDDDLPTMPMRRAYVQLNFETAVKISGIQITGSKLSKCAIALAQENPQTHEFVCGKVKDLGYRNGSSSNFAVTDDGMLVSEILLSASFNSPDKDSDARQLLVKISTR